MRSVDKVASLFRHFVSTFATVCKRLAAAHTLAQDVRGEARIWSCAAAPAPADVSIPLASGAPAIGRLHARRRNGPVLTQFAALPVVGEGQ